MTKIIQRQENDVINFNYHKKKIYNMYQPFFNLKLSNTDVPLNSIRPILAYKSLTSNDNFIMQRSMTESFRANLIKESGLKQYPLFDPRELPDDLRSDEWNTLCELVDNFDSLTALIQYKTLYLLNTLCFYRLVMKLVPPTIYNEIKSESVAKIAYMRAMADYHLNGFKQSFSINDFLSIIKQLPKESLTRHSIALTLTIYYAKINKNIDSSSYFREIALDYLKNCNYHCEQDEYKLLYSRFYRGASYVPFLKNNKVMVKDEMNLAEEYARSVSKESDDNEYIKKDNLYFVLESRMREAIWNNDLDLALERIKEATSLDPWDSRAHIEIGEILFRRGELDKAAIEYIKAARLGPPGTSLGYYMAGYCYDNLDEYELALDYYINSLNMDNLSISSLIGIIKTSKKLGNLPVLNFAKEYIEKIEEQNLFDSLDIDNIRKLLYES